MSVRSPRKRWSGPRRFAVAENALLVLLVLTGSAHAAVFDVTVTDVTTRAFAVVWASDEPVDAAAVHVYLDAAGTLEITQSLSQMLVSASVPSAHEQGLVKVDVAGLNADTTVYVQTETTDGTGTILSPAAPPFLELRTAARTRRSDALGRPIVNDLLLHDVLAPDALTPASTGLLLVSAPDISPYPLSAFVGDGYPAPAAVVNLNNVFSEATGETSEVNAGEPLDVAELRGRVCPGLVDHRLLRLRLAPAQPEVAQLGAALTTLEVPASCLDVDTVCDEVVDVLDAQRILNRFATLQGDCAFNPDLDVIADGMIEVQDVDLVFDELGALGRFGP